MDTGLLESDEHLSSDDSGSSTSGYHSSSEEHETPDTKKAFDETESQKNRTPTKQFLAGRQCLDFDDDSDDESEISSHSDGDTRR
ncbi:unnamed protein product [marine sediment metagenome]|uniref:Uncharacterized protein n=1 Tax=marine sediment metagenome TaxID=412755 RepID=X1A2H5_9ZZZZ